MHGNRFKSSLATQWLASSFNFSFIVKMEEFMMVSTVLWDSEVTFRDWSYEKFKNSRWNQKWPLLIKYIRCESVNWEDGKNELALHIYKSMDISTPPRTVLCRKLVKGDWLLEQRAGGWEGTWHSKTRGRSIPEIEEIASIMAQGLKVSLPCSHFRMKPLWYTLWGRQGGLLTYGLVMGSQQESDTD